MDILEKIVALASSSVFSFVIVILSISFLSLFSYLCYRAGRDLEVFFIERRRLIDEKNFREEDDIDA